MRSLFLATLPLALMACDQSEAPSDQLKVAAGELVDEAAEVVTTEPPKGRYAPRDECEDLVGYAEFREALESAVSRHDKDQIVALAATDVKLDFGGGAGRDELRERLAIPNRHLWDELEALLELGCAANDHEGITIPWYFAQDMAGVDGFSGMLVTDEEVPLRAQANLDAEAIGEISWDVVELVGVLEPDREFQNVRTQDGATGFIATDKLRSLIDYRLIAMPSDGSWQITAFVAGD